MADVAEKIVEAEIVTEQPAAQLPAKRETKATLTAGAPLDAIIPRDLDEAWRLTKAFMDADMVPGSYAVKERGSNNVDIQATRAALMLGIMKGLEVGLPPITALSSIMIINNRPSIWGDGAVALVQSKGMVARVKQEFTGTELAEDWTAWYRIWRVGQSEPYVGKFSVSDAKRARLWANPQKPIWAQYPQRMLMARARAYALRDGFADCLSGLSITEEVQDIPAPPGPVETSFLDEVELKPAPEAANDAPAETTTEPEKPAEETALTDWPAYAEDLKSSIDGCEIVADVNELWKKRQKELTDLQRDTPALFATLTAHKNARVSALKGGK